MYSTCLFCHTPLGANEVVEHFPVGRRLAFDAAKGRLWVVCRKCERWNLTPVEERWEAIEECERSFRSTRLRVSTDQIGMARVKEGLELVRIGKPLRPEFAAWRYGDQFGRRRRNNIVRTGVIVVAAGTIPFLGGVVAASVGSVGMLLPNALNVGLDVYRRKHVVARVSDNDGNLLYVRMSEVAETVMLPPTRDQRWGLRITHRALPDPSRPFWESVTMGDQTDIRGEAAMQVAAQLLPQLNRAGASRNEVAQAVAIATQEEDASVHFEKAARFAKRSWINYGKGAMLTLQPKELRLALEMASHEESERRALEGELYLLEQAWKEAEEIAAISDNLFLPSEISTRLTRLKRDAK